MDDKKEVVSCNKMIEADKAILHLNFTNRRLLIAFIVMCIAFVATFVALTVIFTKANTEREKNILEIMKNSIVTEVKDGLQYQGDP
jgi:hypothetical protein